MARIIKKIRYRPLAKIMAAAAAQQLGQVAFAGGSGSGIMKVVHKSDATASSPYSIGRASGAYGYALAYDSDGNNVLRTWVEPVGGLNAAQLEDVSPYPGGGWVVTGYSTGATTNVYSNDGTSITITRPSTANARHAIWARYDAGGQLLWARTSSYVGAPGSATYYGARGTAVCTLSNGRVFALGNFIHQNTANEMITFNTAKTVVYPRTTDAYFGSRVGTWLVELDATTGEGLSIDTIDHRGQRTSNANVTIDSNYGAMSLVAGHDDTYVLLTTNSSGRPDRGLGSIGVGTGKTGAYITRQFTTQDATNDPNYDRPTKKMVMTKWAVDGAPLSTITAKTGATPLVLNTNARKSLSCGTPVVHDNGDITFMVDIDYNVAITDIDRSPVAYSSPEVLDSGIEKWVMVRTDSDMGKPSDVGMTKIAIDMTTAGIAGNTQGVDAFAQASISPTSDGFYYCTISFHSQASKASVEFFEDVGTSSTVRRGSKIFKLTAAGAIVWSTTLLEAVTTTTNRMPLVKVFESGPMSGKVVAIGETDVNNVQSGGPTNVSDGLVGFDVGTSWAAQGETNGAALQLVYIVYDSSGEVVPADCFCMASFSNGWESAYRSVNRGEFS